jgi:hypothetical protein
MNTITVAADDKPAPVAEVRMTPGPGPTRAYRASAPRGSAMAPRRRTEKLRAAIDAHGARNSHAPVNIDG